MNEGPQVQAPRTRVLLDTNVWSYIADQAAAPRLRSIAREHGLEILVSPAVVFEQLRLTDATVRRRHLEVTTKSWWTRMMPEAFVECHEFVEALRRHRPDWLHGSPTREALARYHANRADWRNGFWRRSRRTPEAEARINADLAGDVPQVLGEQLRERQQEHRVANNAIGTLRLDDPTVATSTVRVHGSRRTHTMDSWRVHSAEHFRRCTTSRDNYTATYNDWLGPFVDLSRVKSGDEWLDFWAEVEPREMPSEWILWAAEVLTPLAKLNRGSAFDLQLTNYVAYADVFVSADRRLVRLVGRIAEDSPVAIARAVRTREDGWPDTLADLVGVAL